jgi:hypothetical protein
VPRVLTAHLQTALGGSKTQQKPTCNNRNPLLESHSVWNSRSKGQNQIAMHPSRDDQMMTE